jgi:hypothetical protein
MTVRLSVVALVTWALLPGAVPAPQYPLWTGDCATVPPNFARQRQTVISICNAPASTVVEAPVTVGKRLASRYALNQSGECPETWEISVQGREGQLSENGRPGPEGDHARERMEEFLRKRLPQRDAPAEEKPDKEKLSVDNKDPDKTPK